MAPNLFDSRPPGSGEPGSTPEGSAPLVRAGSTRPATLNVIPENIPDELKQLNQWVVWKWTYKSNKWTKPPYQVNGQLADSTAPATWTDFDSALSAYESGDFDGVGFVVTEKDDLVGVDFDHCVDGGIIDQWATDAIFRLNSYTEVSPSGTGIRIILRGQLPPGRRKRGDVEMYESGRYLTLTGHTNREGIEHRQDGLTAEHDRWLRSETKPDTRGNDARPTSLSDAEILEAARNAANGAKFDACYRGDNGHTLDGTASAGDLSLISMLAFYTKDPAQLDRLFRGSGRMRDKWNRDDYRHRTIDAALERVTEQYEPTLDWRVILPGSSDNGGTLAELMAEEIEPLRFVVDGLIPEGLTLLAGRPKLGKSWLALGVSLAICDGAPALGHSTKAAETLYISLEDGKRRLQDRVRILGGHHLPPESLRRFHYRTDWPALNQDGLAQLEEWMEDHPDTRLIVIDTWGKVRPSTAGKDRYQEDYAVLGPLQVFATRHRVAIVLIHHLRKQAADDWLEQLSGSQAVTGAADTLLGLFRERGQMDATLRLVSREVDERDLALKFDSGRWESMGDAAAYRQSVERSAVLDALEGLGEGSASDIAPLVDKTPANVSKMLVGLYEVGLVQRVRRGVYSLKTLVDSVEPVDTSQGESTQSTQSTYREDQKAACPDCGLSDSRHGSVCRQRQPTPDEIAGL